MKWLKWLLWPTRKLEQKVRRFRKAMALRLRQRRNFSAYKSIEVASALKVCPSQPLYSLVVPVFRTDLEVLRLCIESVRKQLYSNWELILVDDCSEVSALTAELESWAKRDERIRVFTLAKNQGIAGATNYGISQASGPFVGFLDHDDELTPDALLWMVVAHNGNPHSRWFYSDEATLELDGNYAGRFHRKPAFSWEYLLSAMYTCHFSVYDRKLLEAVGGLRPEFDGAQDHDLALRISECVEPSEVTHIPHVLYFWRATPQSTASSVDAKPTAGRAAYKAVTEAAERRRLQCSIIVDPDISTRFQLHLRPRTTPKVTIVIPTRNAAALVVRCIESLTVSTSYPNYEIVVIDNQSDEHHLARYLTQLKNSGRGRAIRYDKPFNHSDMHNQAIAEIDSDMIVFMNNDVYGFTRDWLEQLVATIEIDESIAGVGAKLFYPDETIQHAGVVIGSCGGLAGHADCKHPGNTPGYYGRSRALHQVSGVTAALMIMRKSAFEAVGGFDAARYPTSFNDVDLWVRLGEAGYRCLFNPAVHAIHEEGKTRTTPSDEGEFQRRLHEDLRRREWRDRYWNLTLFGNLEELFEHERTWDWIPEKVKMLRKEIGKLKAPPVAAALDNLVALLSKSIPDGAYTARVQRQTGEPEPWSTTPEVEGQTPASDLRRELPVSTAQVVR